MTITHSSFQKELEEITSEIQEKTSNLFIEKHVLKPDISEVKLQLLNIFLSHAAVPRVLRKLYCVAAGLIQLGLDLHESVTNHKEFSEKGIRNRQLTILAGDYFSSKYYYLLSKEKSVEEIRKFATGLRNINIVKMKLYTKNNGEGFQSIEQIIDLLKIRESNLYTQFLDKIDSVQQKETWQNIIEDTILLFAISDELQASQVRNNHLAYFLLNYYGSAEEQSDIKEQAQVEVYLKRRQLFHKYDLRRKMEDLVQGIYNNLLLNIKSVEDRLIQGELYYLLNQFSNRSQLLRAVEKI